CAALAAFFTAVGVARRRALRTAQFTRSWLPGLPGKEPTGARGGFALEALPAGIAIGVLCALALLALLAMALGPRPHHLHAIVLLWACSSGGIACGVALSFLIPRAKPADPPPGSRC